MIKLVVSDIDGTLIRDDQTISEANRNAISEVVKRGIPVVLSSGRMHTTAVPFVKQLGLETPVISSNGAMIKQSNGDEVLYVKYLERDLAKKTIDILRAYGQEMHCYAEDTIYIEKEGYVSSFLKKFTDENSKSIESDIKVKMLREGTDDNLDFTKLLKIGYYFNGRENADLAEIDILNIDGLTVVRSNPVLKDIMPQNVTKGESMKFLAESMGIDVSEVLAIGDNHNDMHMLEMAGIGIAMGNAHDIVKQVADDIAPRHDEDGLAWALNKYILEV